MINPDQMLARIDGLLLDAQQASDPAIRDAAIREATQLLRMVREQVESTQRHAAGLRYLVERFEGVIQ